MSTICLDMDGVILNYGNHTTELRINHDFIAHLVELGVKNVRICTNQGGLVFSVSNPAKYPTPERFIERASAAVRALNEAHISVARVHVAVFHPRADATLIDRVRGSLVSANKPFSMMVHLLAEYRKPEPGMLRAAGATKFFGDSDEDGAAAIAWGCEFVRVERFL